MPNQTLIIISIFLSVAALVCALFAAITSVSLNKLKKTFFTGKNGADMEEILLNLSAGLTELNANQSDLNTSLNELRKTVGFAIQKVGIVRFNPFADGGGNFSFTLALLDGHNNGLIITSMHGREQNRIYSKKITAGKSESQLTNEEQQAVLLANNNLST